MKKILFIFLTIVVAVSADHYVKHIKKTIHHKVKEHYHSNKDEALNFHSKIATKRCSQLPDKIKEAEAEFEFCVDHINDSLTFCERSKVFFFECTAPLIKLTKDCAPEERKGLFPLFCQSAYSVFQHLCKQTGETLLELTRSCLWENVKKPNEELTECADTVRNNAVRYRQYGAGPTEICVDAYEFRHCIKARVDFSCKNSRMTNIFLGVYDSATAPCKNVMKI